MGMPTISIQTKKMQAQAPWKMGQFTCLRSCQEDGYVMVAIEDGQMQCLGPKDACTWFQTPFCSQPKPGQAPPTSEGQKCSSFESGWCKEARQVLILKEDPTRCVVAAEFVPERTPGALAANTVSTSPSPATPTSAPVDLGGPSIAAADVLDPSVQIAGDVKASAWKCIRSCHEGHFLLVRDTGLGSIQCSGQNSLSCTWYDDDECRSVSETSLPPVSDRGMTCKRFWPGTWCSEAQSQLWYKNGQTECPDHPDEVGMPPDYRCIQSCADSSDYVRVHEVDGVVSCHGPTDQTCSWFEDAQCTRLNAGASPPVDHHGRTCTQAELEMRGTWCSNFHIVKAGNETECMPKDYGCIVSCRDRGSYVRVRARDLKCAGDLGGDTPRCTWYSDKSCSQRATSGNPPTKDGGRTCVPKDFVEGLWCHAAKKVLWDGEAPLNCEDIPPPPPVHWTCMQSCASQGAYIQVRNGGWSVGLTCNGANNNCTLFADGGCTLRIADSPSPEPLKGYRCKDWDMLTGWCSEARHHMAGSPPPTCSVVKTFIVAAADDAEETDVMEDDGEVTGSLAVETRTETESGTIVNVLPTA
jgi:hypothetical protein